MQRRRRHYLVPYPDMHQMGRGSPDSAEAQTAGSGSGAAGPVTTPTALPGSARVSARVNRVDMNGGGIGIEGKRGAGRGVRVEGRVQMRLSVG